MLQTGKTPKGLRVFDHRYVELVRASGMDNEGNNGRYRDMGMSRALREEQAKLAARREARKAAQLEKLLKSTEPAV